MISDAQARDLAHLMAAAGGRRPKEEDARLLKHLLKDLSYEAAKAGILSMADDPPRGPITPGAVKKAAQNRTQDPHEYETTLQSFDRRGIRVYAQGTGPMYRLDRVFIDAKDEPVGEAVSRAVAHRFVEEMAGGGR